VHQSFQRPTARKLPSGKDRFQDEARFLRSWLERPLVMGAVTPSGKVLARTMASYVDPRTPGPVIELGPGTGPVTDALIRRGIAQDRLILIEYNPEFCQLLKRRFPKATIIQGDAYDLQETLSGILTEPAAATVSSLPLFTKPMDQRLDLLEAAQDLMHQGAPFIQFTYAVVPPIPARSQAYKARASNRIWRNLPPARVWVYNKIAQPGILP
jgi:phosphatidylethanolamine/phosphatidyl-N-methylethanolamine N-methyltransferase